MAQVEVTRTYAHAPKEIESVMADRTAFMRGAGFDRVARDGDSLTVENRVGLFDIELVLEIVDGDAEFVYEQRDGVFESMRTEYHVDGHDGETTVSATTEYEALDLAVFGQVLDETVVERQRTKELNAQFDWLAEQLA